MKLAEPKRIDLASTHVRIHRGLIGRIHQDQRLSIPDLYLYKT